MKLLRLPVSVCFAIAISIIGRCQAAPPEKPAGIDLILAYQGSWDISIERFDTAHSKASKEKTALHNDCWKSGGYFACNQYVNGESKILLVFTFDGGTKTYTIHQIPMDGGDAGSGKLLVDGNTWTFPWQQTEAGKTTWFRVVNVFTAPDTIDYRQEFSTDQVHWTEMAKGLEHKTAGN